MISVKLGLDLGDKQPIEFTFDIAKTINPMLGAVLKMALASPNLKAKLEERLRSPEVRAKLGGMLLDMLTRAMTEMATAPAPKGAKR